MTEFNYLDHDEREKIEQGIESLVIFKSLRKDKVVKNIISILNFHSNCFKKEDLNICLNYVTKILRKLCVTNLNLTEYIYKLILDDDNFYIRAISSGETPVVELNTIARKELMILQKVAGFDIRGFLKSKFPSYFNDVSNISGRIFVPWKNSDIDFVKGYFEYMSNISKLGMGKWTKSSMFIFRKGEIVPVKYPDTQKLSELYGYERERKAVINNTLALIKGKPALNALLYGDAGTGKSSTVKAVVNEYSSEGLRLIQITKEQLKHIPEIVDEISRNPLKFIIFIDDLTFTSGEDCFGALKAMLEGSVSAKAKNMVIYATSNRRHLIKETFSEREGDDIHRNDTMQETLSLSARFGLRVNFSRPDKNDYIEIVKKLAEQEGINMSSEELALKAEQFAISSGNGRSPRTARQFINDLIIGQ